LKLEHLSLLLSQKEQFRALKAIDLLKRLKDLKRLSLRFKWCNSHDQNILNSFMELENIWKSVTRLNFGQVAQEGYESFKRLPEKCPNLRELSLKHYHCDYQRLNVFQKAMEQPYQVPSDYLSSIGAFQRLEKVEIQVGEMSNFIGYFTLPSCIKSVYLHFWNSEWIFAEGENEDTCRKNPMFTRFFERWSELTCLDYLEICYNNDEYGGYDLDFPQELLKRIPKVRSLRLSYLKDNIFDIVSFFEPLKGINKELEELEIDVENMLRLSRDHQKKIQFPKLSKLVVSGELLKGKSLENYIGLFDHSLAEKKEGKVRVVEMTSLEHNSGDFQLFEIV